MFFLGVRNKLPQKRSVAEAPHFDAAPGKKNDAAPALTQILSSYSANI
jgi:hypothetical protein